MALRITPENLESAYEFLRTTEPFKRWKLPPADDVEFHVTRHADRLGDCSDEGESPRIRISEKHVHWTDRLIMTMAHEMCHLHLHRKDGRIHHGPRFQRCARQVCIVHSWDMKKFSP